MNKIIFCFVLNSVVSNHPPVITCHMFFGVSEGHIFLERHQVHFTFSFVLSENKNVLAR